MKRIAFLLVVALLLPTLASCAGFMPQTPGVTTTAPTTTTEPATPLTVTSCTEVSYVNGVRTYRLTFSDGVTADFSVKDGVDGAPGTAGATGPDGTAGAPGASGAPGANGTAPTVVSCEPVSVVGNVTTWRLTFSDNTTAEFTVTDGKTPEGVDWEGLMSRLEVMNDLLSVKAPNMTVGNSTVTNDARTSAGTYTPPAEGAAHITGRAFPMTKSVMFGEADTVYALRLNKFKVYKNNNSIVASGDVTFEVQIRAYDSTKLASKSTLVKSYTTTVTLESGKDYIDLLVTIPRSDLEAIGEDDYFLMNIGVVGTGENALVFSSNQTFHFIPREMVPNEAGKNVLAYTGYTSDGLSEATPGNASSKPITPNIFFCTKMEVTPIDFSGLLNGGNDSTGGNTTEPDPSEENLLWLPEQYDLVVGDPFELFYKGISLCLDSDAYAYELSFSDGKSRGNNYTKKYVWTPTESDIGVHSLTIAVRDNFGRILDTGTVKLNVVNKPKSPDKPLTFLFVGASNNRDGKWSMEVIRRLTASESTAVSTANKNLMCDGLTNIQTIGTQKKSLGYTDFYYEGYGGWNFESYTTDYSKQPYFVYITGNFGSLTLSQHSFYKDKNGAIWKLEAIEGNKLKLIAVTSVGGNVNTSCKGLNVASDGKSVPQSGELTLVSGGANDAKTLSYSAVEYAEGNPFWSVEKGRNDFKAYAEKHGVESIDEVVVNLGWNSINNTTEKFIESVKTFVDGVLADFPDCHINLVSLALPARDGLGENYGVSWDYYEICLKVYEFQQACIDFANQEAYRGSVSVVSAIGQIDTENGYLTDDRPVSNRVPTEETIQYNGVHFNDSGHQQQADAIYRHVVTRLQGK